jgi:hypothetical protein
MEPIFDVLGTRVTSAIQFGEPFLIAHFNYQPIPMMLLFYPMSARYYLVRY